MRETMKSEISGVYATIRLPEILQGLDDNEMKRIQKIRQEDYKKQLISQKQKE